MGDARADLEAGLSPEELIPGDIQGIQDAATNAGGYGNQLALTVRGVKYLRINGQDWTGLSYDAYSLASEMHVSDLQNATTAFDNAATALTTYAQALTDARNEAADARHRYIMAKRTALSDPTKPDPSLITTTPTKQGPPAPLRLYPHDSNGHLVLPNDPLTAAVSQLETARKNVKSAAADLAKTLNSATKDAPEPKHETWKDRLKDTGSSTVHTLTTMGTSPFKLLLDTDDKLSGHGDTDWHDIGKDLLGTLALGGLLATGRGGDLPEEPVFPRSGGPKNEVIPEGDIASITTRLQSHVDAAVQLYDNGTIGMSRGQIRRLATDPGLEDAFRGQVIDKYVKDAVRNDPSLNNLLWVSRPGEFGPDFHDVKTNTWWDVTTPGQWGRHVRLYSNPFGDGIGLMTK